MKPLCLCVGPKCALELILLNMLLKLGQILPWGMQIYLLAVDTVILETQLPHSLQYNVSKGFPFNFPEPALCFCN